MTRTYDRVIFIDSERGTPDRGWKPDSVVRALGNAGIPSCTEWVQSSEDVQDLVVRHDSGLFWPLNYSYSPRNYRHLIVDVLDFSGTPYVGCDPQSARFTSKLNFKAQLVQQGIDTPAWQCMEHPSTPVVLRTPVYVKTEFSCDSQGIRRVSRIGDLEGAAQELDSRFANRLFVEVEAGRVEWTIGMIISEVSILTASMRLIPIKAPFIDVRSKSDNAALQFQLPSARDLARLEAYARTVIGSLRLSGYARMDVIGTTDGRLEAIDFNVLPSMNDEPGQLSYLPMAFMLSTGCSYSDVVGAILGSVDRARGVPTPSSPMQRFITKSALMQSGAHNV